jgi:hypothetical protein
VLTTCRYRRFEVKHRLPDHRAASRELRDRYRVDPTIATAGRALGITDHGSLGIVLFAEVPALIGPVLSDVADHQVRPSATASWPAERQPLTTGGS